MSAFDYISVIDEMTSAASATGVSVNVEEIFSHLKRPANSQINTLVTGAENSGKSSFVNKLLNGALSLPTQPFPSRNTIGIAYTDKKPYYYIETDSVERDMATISSVKRCSALHVFINSDFLKNLHMRITEDSHNMPSLVSPGVEMSAASYLIPYDLVVVVMSAQQAFASSDLQFLKICKAAEIPTVIVVSFCDTLEDEDEVQELRGFVSQKAREVAVEEIFYLAPDNLGEIRGQIGEIALRRKANRAVPLYLSYCIDSCIDAIEGKMCEAEIDAQKMEAMQKKKELSRMRELLEWKQTSSNVSQKICQVGAEARTMISKLKQNFVRSVMSKLNASSNPSAFLTDFRTNLLPSFLDALQDKVNHHYSVNTTPVFNSAAQFLQRFGIEDSPMELSDFSLQDVPCLDAEVSDVETLRVTTKAAGVAAVVGIASLGWAVPVMGGCVALASHIISNSVVKSDKKRLAQKLEDFFNQLQTAWLNSVSEKTEQLMNLVSRCFADAEQRWKASVGIPECETGSTSLLDALVENKAKLINIKSRL